VSGFSAEWLALREPVDAAARSRVLAAAAAESLGRTRPVRALDLATGTGSNVRFLAGYLPFEQEWLLVDADEQLLRRLPSRLPGLRFDAKIVDLNVLAHAGIIDGRALVTASALLDLVSDRWLAMLAGACARAGATVLFALSYDGRILLSPEDPQDARVRELVNAHQRTDKGFGPALGPDAVVRAEEHLARAGYRTRRESSDWVLGEADHRQLQGELIVGWAVAAREMAPQDESAIAGWRDRRLGHLTAGRSAVIVGHVDLLGTKD
jgi:hypothetical protein